jgi:hypothetical protein
VKQSECFRILNLFQYVLPGVGCPLVKESSVNYFSMEYFLMSVLVLFEVMVACWLAKHVILKRFNNGPVSKYIAPDTKIHDDTEEMYEIKIEEEVDEKGMEVTKEWNRKWK